MAGWRSALAGAGMAVMLVACGGTQAATRVTVTTTALSTAKAATVTATKIQTVTMTETVTQTVATTMTTVMTRISAEAACQLLLYGPNGTEGASKRLADLAASLGATITPDAAASAVSQLKTIRAELSDLMARAPDSWSVDLQDEVAATDQLVLGLTSGQVHLDSSNLTGAGKDLASKCGA